MSTTELKAGLQIIKAVADTIRELGRAPRGVLYSALMARGVSVQSYETIEGILIRGGLVRKAGDELIWCAATPDLITIDDGAHGTYPGER